MTVSESTQVCFSERFNVIAKLLHCKSAKAQMPLPLSLCPYIIGVDVPGHIAIGDQLTVDIATDLGVPPAVVDVHDADHVPLENTKARKESDEMINQNKIHMQQCARLKNETKGCLFCFSLTAVTIVFAVD